MIIYEVVLSMKQLLTHLMPGIVTLSLLQHLK